MQAVITERAFIVRMKRHLQKDGLALYTAREDTKGFQELGRFYTVNKATNFVEDKGLSLSILEEWAREDGVLKPHEAIESTA